jgi:hypothetical protein
MIGYAGPCLRSSNFSSSLAKGGFSRPPTGEWEFFTHTMKKRQHKLPLEGLPRRPFHRGDRCRRTALLKVLL